MEILLVLPPLVLVGFFVWYCSKDRVIEKKFFCNYFDKVRWIVLKSQFGSISLNDSRRTFKEVRDRDLIDYIQNEQYELFLENDYKIDLSNEEEKEFICDILNSHKQEVITSLFYDALKKEKRIYQLDFLEYYMVSLLDFLTENQIKSSFAYYDKMYKLKTSEDGAYNIYALTPNGIAYQKLFLIVTLFCEKNAKTRALFNNHIPSSRIIENLNNNEIKIVRYRT